MKTDWAWFDDAHEESHDEYHVADRREVLGNFTAWLDRFLTRTDARYAPHDREKPPADIHDTPNPSAPS